MSDNDQVEHQVDENNDENEKEEANDDVASVASDTTVEPNCQQANNISFALICSRMENLFQQRIAKKKRRVSQEEKYSHIMPAKLLNAMKARSESIFPLLRLYCPDIDNARSYNVKERAIVNAYMDALSLGTTSKSAEMLKNFTDPQYVPAQLVGDLSLVVEQVMKERRGFPPSKMKLEDINTALDDLADIHKKKHHHNHRWREGTQDDNTGKPKKKLSEREMREKWLKRVIDMKQLSPVEHKWLVRIIMKKPEFGMRSQTILKYYSKYALEIWGANNSLKSLCNKLANPEYERNRRILEHEERRASQGLSSRWDPQTQPVVLGNVCTPMLSSKLTFDKAMTQITSNHAEYLKTAPDKECLALKFPTICVETKLDGERMIIHVKNGKVTMHTRSATWYSKLYCPVLGPAIRRALQNYEVDAIFDGEVMAWDNKKKELVPFGLNRTVANYRRAYLEMKGLLEAIDTNFHEDGSTDARVMTKDDDWANKSLGDDADDGKECWLLFCVFDLLYVGGKDATRLLQKDCGLKDASPGSIIHLPCLERKQVLQQLLVEQEHEIEICQSVVIRPNGDRVPGDEYYGQKVLEHGYERTLLDSTQVALNGTIPTIAEIDAKQLGDWTHDQTSAARARHVEDFFGTVVENYKKEGIVVKDLAAPYILGEPSRRRKYWHKFKPDYERGTGNAVDLDVVILGAYWACGLKNSGKISSFLCGCVDAEDSSSFMTFCNVNGASTGFDRLSRLMAHTGFKSKSKDGPMDLGRWYRSSDLPAGEELPEFISSRSLQRGEEDYNGWKYTKNKNYPDLWINPEDSIVLTIEGQELITTDEYSAGVCLRFPKIIKIRLDEIDGGKPVNEIETDRDLWDSYYTIIRQREQSAKAFEPSQHSQSQSRETLNRPAATRRFLTPEEFKSKTKKRKRKEKTPPSSKFQKVEQQTKILSGYTFVVLEGKYSLDPESLDAKAASEEGWLELAKSCTTREQVREFILTHGGSVKIVADIGDKFILGGKETDVRVIQYMKAIKNARVQVQTATTKSKKTQDLMKMADSEGILKWTFVFSMVHRWKHDRKINEENDEMLPAIKEVDPNFLMPKVHHYLTLDPLEQVDITQDIYDLDNTNLTETDFERALQEIENRNDEEFEAPWQNKSYWLGRLDQIDGIENVFEKIFWPFDWSIPSGPQVVLYPLISMDIQVSEDVVDEGIEYWYKLEGYDSVLSTLPMARGMGAIVSSNFCEQVTHIVCDLKDGFEGIISTSDAGGVGPEIFRDEGLWQSLMPHLKSAVDNDRDVKIISPTWIKKQWDHFCN